MQLDVAISTAAYKICPLGRIGVVRTARFLWSECDRCILRYYYSLLLTF